MRLSAFQSAGLARRFTFVAAGLAAAAVLLTAIASSWLIDRQHDLAVEELGARERQYHAAAVASNLQALVTRISEVASSTILATGLVDSAGRETYLVPYLAGVRQINGIPIHVSFTDFEGKEIASNGAAAFTQPELDWLRRELEQGRTSAAVFSASDGDVLVALEPLRYARTSSPEGALFYKFAVADLQAGERTRLEWGEEKPADVETAPATRVAAPAVFLPLNFRVRGPLTPATPLAQLTPQYLAIGIIALTLFAVVVVAGARLGQVLTRDLRRLEAFSRKFISSGLSTERAPVHGSGEVASLAISINEMLDRLHEQHSALLREREKLSELADALKAADRRKDDFLALLAHELRNPLAPIRNSVAVLKAVGGEEPRLVWARDVIDRQVAHMARLLDDLLDVSRITRNKLELRRERVELARVIDSALEASRPLIEARSHELAVDLPAEPVHVDGDPVRLAQVVSNLLNNAAKYTPPGGRIAVHAERENGNLVLTVRDNGMGIPPEAQPRLFEMFSQAAAGTAHQEGGMGIGLSLVKALVEMHGGTVGARSDGPDRGSEFIVRLPIAESDLRDAPATSKDAPARAPVQRRIVVADDNRDAADSLALMLRVMGNEVRTAPDGVQALSVAASFRPDVMILDIGMPHLDGYDTARRVRSEPWGKDVLLVAATGWGQDHDKQRASRAGFDHHLTKPLDLDALQRLLNEGPRSA